MWAEGGFKQTITAYYQKARELAALILASDPAKALAEARITEKNLIQAEIDYRALVDQVINMIKATVYDDIESDSPCGGCKQRRCL